MFETSENTEIPKCSHWLHTMAGEDNDLRGGQVKPMFGTTVQLFNLYKFRNVQFS